ncbi:hypothetical protein QUF90_25340 [Desulfococcaceae bacterium HSG9]|nr:hypothetical protein [Desulfococcaceae bacterium HSG9]
MIKFTVKLTGLIFILLAIICNPYTIIKQPPSFVKFDNLLHIKIFIIFAELFLLSLGIIWFFKPERVISKIKYLNPLFLYRDKKKELTLLLFSCIVSLIILELFSRMLFANANRLPFMYSAEEMIYPALYNIRQNYTDEGVNILLLGGSVLFENAKFFKEMGRRHSINFYNAAYIAHTTLDSLYKYKYLTKNKLKFDYVIFYHGINDVRLNNIPSEFFQDDYSHYYYYKLINKTFKYNEPKSDLFLNSTMGYNFYNLFCRFYSLTRFRKMEFMPYDIPVPELTRYGDEIKSAKSFRKNLNKIIRMSKTNNAVLIVPYFAFRQAPDNAEMTNIWGNPKNVIKGIIRHNEIISEMQDRFVTINTEEISVDRAIFTDICHLTIQGQKKFGELIIKKLLFQRSSLSGKNASNSQTKRQ